VSSGSYGAKSGQPGTLSAAQGTNDPIHGAIHLVCGIARASAIIAGDFFQEFRFLHLPGAYHATVRLNG
jgi:energy-converting hydrogenase Eha subunit H